jgi:translation initiation factor IF-3
VIDENGQQLGILNRYEALERAELAGLDLVEISPDASPPVAKIVDWGKYNYQRTKQQQKNRKNSKVLDVKQIRFGLKIGEHDLEIKMNKAREFIDEGHKVKLTAVYRGRELAHKEIGYKVLDKALAILGEDATTDQPPLFAGKQLTMVIRSNNAKNKNS